MRICYILPSFVTAPPGGYRIVYLHAQHLTKRGHKVFVIHPQEEYHVYPHEDNIQMKGWYKELKAKLKKLSLLVRISFLVKKIRLKMLIPDLPFSCLYIIPALKKEFLHRNLDVIVATWWETAYFVHSISTDTHIRKFYLCQHYEIWGGPLELVKASYEFSDLHLIAVSRWIFDQIKKHHKRNANIVLNGLVYEGFYPRKKPKSYLLRIGYIYRDKMPFKGYELFKEVYLALRNNTKITFIIASNSDCPEEITQNSSIINTSSLKAMNDFYNSIDLLLYPSESEGFGLPIIEAMACGTPVVSTPVGIALDVIINDINSYVSKHFVAQELIEKISKYHVMSRYERSLISKEAIKVAKSFNWEAQIPLLETLFHLNDSK